MDFLNTTVYVTIYLQGYIGESPVSFSEELKTNKITDNKLVALEFSVCTKINCTNFYHIISSSLDISLSL